ncbi:tRNA 2-thiouridine(34) synthase MnmA [Adlercreutzia sp. ZJ242]|uniref:tRNA 2-thiouridine(34) synthase MnmA n=1 Tax=Adlercreutzia sp. ZJ242 TaxID=2709409 RepID=UPI001F14C60A|nr:tRNA 2-thiouridine(34) synthase MnmA [Adlercreutzia sp. ZJ242]
MLFLEDQTFGGKVERGRRVALGMSGGVDSSTAVLMLQHHGYEVLGVTCVFMPGAAARAAVSGARETCAQLGAEHVAVDCAGAFEERVVAPFADGCARGLTPSPCVGCNARCKLPALMGAADAHGCDFVATGHYARVGRLGEDGRYAVMRALDHAKDQSYMLSQLSQEQLARLILPLGGMTKLEVREVARAAGIAAADAPDSQDICFAPQGYRALLAQRGVAFEPGDIVDVRGQVRGRHAGLACYTAGQRRGIGVAGPEPYYVVGKRADANELVIGTREESLIRQVRVGQMAWQAIEPPGAPLEAMVKLRYRSEPCACIMRVTSSGSVAVELASPQPATAPGQHAVFYQGATVLGGGVIEEVA